MMQVKTTAPCRHARHPTPLSTIKPWDQISWHSMLKVFTKICHASYVKIAVAKTVLYITAKNKVFPTFFIFWPHKNRTGSVLKNVLSEFHEKRLSERRSVILGVNWHLCSPHLLADLSEIWCMRCAHNALNICEFRENQRRERYTFVTVQNGVRVTQTGWHLLVYRSKRARVAEGVCTGTETSFIPFC